MKGRRIAWTPLQLAFVKRRGKWARLKLHAAFVKRFRRRDISAVALASLCKRSGWLTAPRVGRFKGRSTAYSKAELAWIKRRRKWPRRELHAAFVQAFGRPDLAVDALKQLCHRRGWRTGRDGRIKKGAVPANKGKRMPYNANSARTRFKKGNRTGRANQVYKPIGTIRLSKEGYSEIKIHDGLPMQSRWRAVHLVSWERKRGPIPAGMCLKCKGHRLNTDPSNWELVPRGLLPRLNGKSGRGYDSAPEDLKRTIMALAKLEHRLHERRQGSVPK